MSDLKSFSKRLLNINMQAKKLGSHTIRVGWVDGATEQPRTKANASKKKDKKGKSKDFVSNFNDKFIGPGLKSASLATIAKTLCYGRAGGRSIKDGHEYGRIPARNFVDVLRRKYCEPVYKAIAKELLEKENGEPINMQFLGVMCKGQLQRAMKDSNEYAKNSAITIRGGWMANPKNKKPFYVEPKGSSRPLWNTGTLIRSVDFEIKDK